MTATFGEGFGLDGGTRATRLTDKFIVPPFSVLDTRQGYWQERKRAWLSLGIQSEIGRGGDGANSFSPHSAALSGGWDGHPSAVKAGPARAFNMGLRANAGNNWSIEDDKGSGTSLFDPVLCELMYRWFAPEGGTILDPFAGGSVRGIVAAHLGHPYTGIDLSARQIEANRAQVGLLAPDRPVPEWIVGDSSNVLPRIADGVDLVFSCPPYFDLEVYSDDPADLSAMTWHGFLAAYERIIELAVQKLAKGRYAVFVVSEIRGPGGTYRGLVPRTIHAFERSGASFYNELILVNAIGSLPIRITKQFEAQRKIGRTHQNILVFVKGEPPRGWSYEREAPADPQAQMFDIAPLLGPWICAACGKDVPAGPIIAHPMEPKLGHGLCYACDDITEWGR
jgi:DNA modification methylase